MQVILKYLLLLRSLVIAGQLIALAIIHWGIGLAVPWVPVLGVLGALVALTALSWQRARHAPAIRQREFVAQLLADIAALTVLVYFTGGSVNPFISLFLLPIVFAAAAMPPAYTVLIAVAAVICYTLLMFFHVPLIEGHLHTGGFDLHLWGMWYGFVISAAGVAAFVARIARTAREQDQALARAREQALRAERVVALGTLAAGTAHELGTPLATMAALAKDLELDLRDNPALSRNLGLLRTQIQRCKAILAQLAADAGELPTPPRTVSKCAAPGTRTR